ncbi:hypothetical protein PLEOSDRAFT_1089642 [Pleurotus ostreatus PC15]|uniref:Uncharacterized protein n=1 Tax=Pleurotus ostreatus (strain PC15) TaxID=1137138 RepID=A0A067NVU2_PLEO1|nr:hypothetical protein PLEOSDRAFT_1089642 [Pleurotus ostreatus PC15]
MVPIRLHLILLREQETHTPLIAANTLTRATYPHPSPLPRNAHSSTTSTPNFDSFPYDALKRLPTKSHSQTWPALVPLPSYYFIATTSATQTLRNNT